MRIFLTNDDGISSPYLALLASAARQFGEVLVVAPPEQYSASSHRITLGRDLELRRRDDYLMEEAGADTPTGGAGLKKRDDLPLYGVEAYTLDGSPADCVRACFMGLLREKMPDVVFSGVNQGSNCGFDIQYSATIGAAMEALTFGVPAICFSQKTPGSDEVLRNHLGEMIEKYMSAALAEKASGKPVDTLFNINFPSVPEAQYRGVLEGVKPDRQAFFDDYYHKTDPEKKDGPWMIHMDSRPVETGGEGTDIQAVLEGCIAVGRVRNAVL